MKKILLIIVLIGCILSQAACAAEVDHREASNVPQPEPVVESTGQQESEINEELAEAEQEYREEIEEIEHEWAEEQRELQEEMAELEREWKAGEFSSRAEFDEEMQELQEEMAELGVELHEEFRDAQSELHEAQKELKNAGIKLKGSGFDIKIPSLGHFSFHGNMFSGQQKPILLIPEKTTDSESFGQLVEDMQVMSMILKDAVGTATAPGVYGYRAEAIVLPGFLGRSGSFMPEAIWLDGYGVVFTLRVDFPLISMEEKGQEQPKTEQEKTDEVWQRSKNQLKGITLPDVNADRKGMVFDPIRVRELQKKLIKSLRHASNIRNLTAKDRIVVVVRGAVDKQSPESDVPTSIMTLQAAKQDIDAFADEKIDLEVFTKKTAVIIY